MAVKPTHPTPDGATRRVNRRAFLTRMAGFGFGVSATALLAACGAPVAPEANAPAATDAPASPTSAPASAAATSVPASAAATSAPATTSALDPVELTYIYPIFGTNKDQQAVEDAVNQITKAKINATVKLQALDYNAFEQRAKLVSASGEPGVTPILSDDQFAGAVPKYEIHG